MSSDGEIRFFSKKKGTNNAQKIANAIKTDGEILNFRLFKNSLHEVISDQNTKKCRAYLINFMASNQQKKIRFKSVKLGKSYKFKI
jgi:hypothetical protein